MVVFTIVDDSIDSLIELGSIRGLQQALKWPHRVICISNTELVYISDPQT